LPINIDPDKEKEAMSSEHPLPLLEHSLASSESTLDQNSRTDMPNNEVKRTTFEPSVPEAPTDIVSEADDAAQEHEEGNESHIHSEEENDGI
jgi:hypothetical protein